MTEITLTVTPQTSPQPTVIVTDLVSYPTATIQVDGLPVVGPPGPQGPAGPSGVVTATATAPLTLAYNSLSQSITGSISAASHTAAGTMSSSDKVKLDGLPSTIPTSTTQTLQQVTDAGATTTDTITANGFSGNGASLTSLNASTLSTGTVPTARLGSGFATAGTYLRGDQTWASLPAAPTPLPPTLQQVADAGNTTSDTITVAGITVGVGGSSGTMTICDGNLTKSPGDPFVFDFDMTFDGQVNIGGAGGNAYFDSNGNIQVRTGETFSINSWGGYNGSDPVFTLAADYPRFSQPTIVGNIWIDTSNYIRSGSGQTLGLVGNSTNSASMTPVIIGDVSTSLTGAAIDMAVAATFRTTATFASNINFSGSIGYISTGSGHMFIDSAASHDIYLRSNGGNTTFSFTSAGTLIAPGTISASTFSGNGASLSSLNASSLSSGTVSTARLGSGTASSGTYLRGDGTWTGIPTSPTPTLSAVVAAGAITSSTVTAGGLNTSGTVTAGAITASSASFGASDPYAKFQFVTDDDYDPTTIYTWDSRHTVFGEDGPTGAGVGFSYSPDVTQENINFLSPSLFWVNAQISAGTFNLVSQGAYQGLYQDAGGNVGIQTTAPETALDVAGDVTVQGALYLTADDGSRWRLSVSSSGVLSTTSA